MYELRKMQLVRWEKPLDKPLSWVLKGAESHYTDRLKVYFCVHISYN